MDEEAYENAYRIEELSEDADGRYYSMIVCESPATISAFQKRLGVEMDNQHRKPKNNRGDYFPEIDEHGNLKQSEGEIDLQKALIEGRPSDDDLEAYAQWKIDVIKSGNHILFALQSPIDSGRSSVGQKLKDPGGLHYAFGNDYVRDEKDGKLYYVNEREVRKQRGVVTWMMKKIGANLLSGKSIMNISLPVDIFERRSILVRNASLLGFAPLWIDRAAQILGDPLEQFRLAISYLTSKLHYGVEQKKPFNPIWGETFQGFVNGCPCYYEQVSHHPPIFSFQFYGHDYTIDGSLEMEARATPNTMKGAIMGLERITFKKTGNVIYMRNPFAVVEGLTYGKRSVHYVKKAVFFDPQNRLYCRILFDPDQSFFSFNRRFLHDHFEGEICRVSEAFVNAKLKEIKEGNKKLKAKPEDLTEVLGRLSGSFLDHLKIDEKVYWKIKELRPYAIEEASAPLPSDSTFREDMLYLLQDNIPMAQKKKEEMEELQRLYRRLRAEYRKRNGEGGNEH
eukprot:TRINITY_DN8154_c0_g1_i2.p1 TRINITY_DN8154_c0_g1~~TRINITY_DN8154_c0_g1_i2.p1  ORF type:complete len:508 (+),score=150.31 TRINITY_DN8154_c0_g1_i2:198-1721(+)